MNTHGLHYAPLMTEVSTFDQYSLRNSCWAKCEQRASATHLPPLQPVEHLQCISHQQFEPLRAAVHGIIVFF
jgi:hypothetical protein